MYPGTIRTRSSRPPGVHHGVDRRGRHLPRVRGTGEPARPSLPRASACNGSATTRSSWRTTTATSSRAPPANDPACSTRASTRTSPPRNSATSSTTASRRSLITSLAKRATVLDAIATNDRVTHVLVVDDDGTSGDDRVRDFATGARRPSDVTHPRRAGRHRDALLLGYDRSSEGHHPAASRSTARRDAGALRVPPRSVALPRGHDLPVAGAAVPLGAAGRRRADDPHAVGRSIIMERFDPVEYLRLVERFQVTHSQLVPTMFSRLLKLPEDERDPPRPVVARDRRPRRRAVPDTGEGGDDRVVGPDHPRVLRRHRRAGLHGLRQRGVARPQGHRGQGDARSPAHPRRRHERGGEGLAGHDLVRDGDAVRVPQRRREDARGHLAPTAR